MMAAWPGVLLLSAIALGGPGAADEPGVRVVDFAREVRPILARHCYACHGPDDAQRKADLRLDLPVDAFADRGGYQLVAAGKPDDSELLARIESTEPTERMPPDSAKALEPSQIAVIRRWIEQGGKWSEHWSFVRPALAPLPEVAEPGWAASAIDRFILARLEKAGLTHAPDAAKSALLRRVSLDLTGLPPSPAIARSYLEDSSPTAFPRLVDRLLANPGFGERWAAQWLDLARYADTKGYEKDLKRNIWRYRDWVIASFNADQPYDAFTIDQLAGDLLSNPTPDQRLATAFHRNTLTNDEGGTDDEEFRIAAVKDRLDTTLQVWMGLTVGCAKCHTHKYDPISIRDYYQLLAYFNQTEDNDRGDDAPAIAFPRADELRTIAELEGRLGPLRAELASRLESGTPSRLEQWEASRKHACDAWRLGTIEHAQARSGAAPAAQLDGSVLFAGEGPPTDTYSVTLPLEAGPLAAVRLEALPDPSLPRNGSGRSRGDGNFVLSQIQLELQGAGGELRPLAVAHALADFSQESYGIENVLQNADPRRLGWAVSPRQREPHQAVFRLREPVEVRPGDRLVLTLDHSYEGAGSGFALGRFRLSTSGDPAAALTSALPRDVGAILSAGSDGRTADQKRRLAEAAVREIGDLQALGREIGSLEKRIAGIRERTRTPVLAEVSSDRRRVSRIHRRGNFLDPGDEVQPATPQSFAALESAEPTRLGLARWLVADSNPLTARVAANRVWARLMGTGLVETQEDFGTQGQPPSHPELLDWLALDFQEHGYSLKQLCRRIVTSRMYGQSSAVTPEQLAGDRRNQLFGRSPRYRLDAETVRDSALAASGLLSQRMLGESVMPHQPDGIWQSTYNSDQWRLSPGADHNRRGLYTFWKRSSPYPAMTTFDAPSRETCTIRRIGTNTPLQALVTLNDPAFVQAAQALARRMIAAGGSTLAERIATGLRLALVREPQPREIAALASLYEEQRARFASQPAEARELATNPLGPLPENGNPAEYAAMTSVANVILNLDEFLTRP